MDEIIINKVSESGLVSLDLAAYYPADGSTVVFDLKPFLFMELILKEKDFREQLKSHDWTQYSGKFVGVTCTADAVIPIWAYMLVAANLQPFAKAVFVSNESDIKEKVLLRNIEGLNMDEFAGKRVVVKGCGELPISESAYLAITVKLRPVVKSIMYGEPCSTVPIFKNRNVE
jgi:hypothetical protein